MVFVPKSEALNKNGSLKTGVKEITLKSGAKRYVVNKPAPKKPEKKTKATEPKVKADPKKKSTIGVGGAKKSTPKRVKLVSEGEKDNSQNIVTAAE